MYKIKSKTLLYKLFLLLSDYNNLMQFSKKDSIHKHQKWARLTKFLQKMSYTTCKHEIDSLKERVQPL